MKRTKKYRKKLQKKAEKQASYFVINSMYLAGLTVLIPFVLSLRIPVQIGLWKGTPASLFLIAISLLGISVLWLHNVEKKWNKVFRYLALITLWPAGAALFFTVFSRSLVFGIIETFWGRFEQFEPVVNSYLDSLIPDLAVLTACYVILGAVLYFISKNGFKK